MRVMKNDSEMLNSHWGVMLPKHLCEYIYIGKHCLSVFEFLFTYLNGSKQMKNRWEKTANEKSKQCAQRKLHECFWICVCIQFGTYANGEKKCFHWTKLFGSISFEGKLKCILCIGVEKKRSTFLHKNLEYIFCTRELCILNIIWNSELDVIKNNVAVSVRPHEKGASPQFHSISSMNTI